MIDFGEAQFNIRQGMTMVGTNGYMAPEIYFHIGQYDS
jgi:serine/threonine protein kinase